MYHIRIRCIVGVFCGDFNFGATELCFMADMIEMVGSVHRPEIQLNPACFIGLKINKFSYFSWLENQLNSADSYYVGKQCFTEILWKSARFLHQKSIEIQLDFFGYKYFENQVVIHSFSKLQIFWKLTFFLGYKSFENQLVFYTRNLLKISLFICLEILRKLARFLHKKSFESQLVF